MRAIVAAAIVLGWCTVAGAAEPLPTPTGPVLLTITGAIEQTNAPGEARFDRGMLEALGSVVVKTTTPWTDGVKTFDGASLSSVLARVGARGSTLRASALNDYQVHLPMSDLRFNLILAMSMDGRLLTSRDKGPLWIVYPRDANPELAGSRYEQRWVWQLNRLHIE